MTVDRFGKSTPAWLRRIMLAGYQDAYSNGERVTFQGAVYECLSDGVTWSPAEAPQHWKRI